MRTIRRNIASAFFVSKDGKVLLGKNRAGGVFEGYYVVPGGGIEDGETKEQGLHREMLEETGIDIAGLAVSQVNLFEGSHPKTLRDTEERVMVDMTFNDFRVDLDERAADVTVVAGDDWSSPRWFTSDELQKEKIADFTAVTLKKMGFLPE
jgi:8-oxo-dGTP pyrophosphatase MutT (NUDIX family)